MLTIEQLYDLNHTLAADYLRQFTYPWEALAGIKRRRRIWVRPASSARGRKCGIARSSAAVRW